MKLTLLSIVVVVAMIGLVYAIPVYAVPVTITGPDEEISGDTKICIYEGHGTTETVSIPKSRNCPYSKTFEVDENEDE